MTTTAQASEVALTPTAAVEACMVFAREKNLITDAGLPNNNPARFINAYELLTKLLDVQRASKNGIAEIAPVLPTLCYLAGQLLAKSNELPPPAKSSVPDQRPMWLVEAFTTMNLAISQAAKR